MMLLGFRDVRFYLFVSSYFSTRVLLCFFWGGIVTWLQDIGESRVVIEFTCGLSVVSAVRSGEERLNALHTTWQC